MNALELADFMQSKYDLFPNSEQMQVAALLRRQHEAIKQLRGALTNIERRSSLDSYANVLAKKALADTEEFQ